MRLPVPSLTLTAVCAVTLCPTPARAARPVDVDLRWSAPEASPEAPPCPEEARVRAAIERLARRPLRSPGGSPVRVAIDVTPVQGAWTVRIAIEHPGEAAPHERRIRGATCTEVADAAAVVVAVALAEGAASRLRPAPAPGVVPVEHPAESLPLPVGPAVRAALRVSGGADFASLPAPTFGVEPALVIVVGPDRVELGGSLWLPETAQGTAMASAQVSLAAAGARYCRAFLPGAVEIGGCVGLEAGALRGSGGGVTHPASGASPWVAPGLGVLGEWAFAAHLSLAVGLDALVPVVRDSFQVAGLGELYRPPPVTARALLGLETRFR